MTSHELARKLLEGEDLPIVVGRTTEPRITNMELAIRDNERVVFEADHRRWYKEAKKQQVIWMRDVFI